MPLQSTGARPDNTPVTHRAWRSAGWAASKIKTTAQAGEEARRNADMMNALNAEMTIRHVDGQLVYFVCGLEEGEENQNSHLQLTYMLQVAERNKTTSAAEKKWLKRVVQDAANASMRVTFKTVKKGNEKYVVGYCIKD